MKTQKQLKRVIAPSLIVLVSALVCAPIVQAHSDGTTHASHWPLYCALPLALMAVAIYRFYHRSAGVQNK